MEIDLGSHALAEVVVNDAAVAASIGSRDAHLVARGADGQPVHVIARVEGEVGNALVRCFLFGFPRTPGRITLAIERAADLRAQLELGHRRLRRWAEYGRYAAILPEEPGDVALLESVSRDAQRHVATLTSSRSRRASMPDNVYATAQALDLTSSYVRELVLESLGGLLEGPLWPVNLILSEYALHSVSKCACPACDATALRRAYRHAVHHERRSVITCPSCGIVDDVLATGDLGGVSTSVDGTFRVGDVLQVALRPQWRRGDQREWRSICRLCPPSMSVAAPPAERVEPSSADLETWSFRIPSSFPPHMIFVKSIVATTDELAFSSRKLLLFPQRSEAQG